MSTRRIKPEQMEMQAPEPDDLGVEKVYPIMGLGFNVNSFFHLGQRPFLVPEESPEWFYYDNILYHATYPPPEGYIWG